MCKLLPLVPQREHANGELEEQVAKIICIDATLCSLRSRGDQLAPKPLRSREFSVL